MSLELLKILPDVEGVESTDGVCTGNATTIFQEKARAKNKLVVKLKVPKQNQQVSPKEKGTAKAADCFESTSVERSRNSDDDEQLPL